MKNKASFISLLASLIIYFLTVSSCMPPVFSELQSARTAGKGKVEATAGVSLNYSVFKDEGKRHNEHYYDHAGIHLAYGLTEQVDLRARFEYVGVDDSGESGGTYNIFGMGPKWAISENRFAIYLPVGFAFGGEIEEVRETWQFHPTLLFTVPVTDYLEFNPSGKVLIPFNKDLEELVAFNFGLGLSSDFDKYAVRPEFGLLYNPGEKGRYQHFSIGVTLYPGAWEK